MSPPLGGFPEFPRAPIDPYVLNSTQGVALRLSVMGDYRVKDPTGSVQVQPQCGRSILGGRLGAQVRLQSGWWILGGQLGGAGSQGLLWSR